jgi:hypothetical protein
MNDTLTGHEHPIWPDYSWSKVLCGSDQRGEATRPLSLGWRMRFSCGFLADRESSPRRMRILGTGGLEALTCVKAQPLRRTIDFGHKCKVSAWRGVRRGIPVFRAGPLNLSACRPGFLAFWTLTAVSRCVVFGIPRSTNWSTNARAMLNDLRRRPKTATELIPQVCWAF